MKILNGFPGRCSSCLNPLEIGQEGNICPVCVEQNLKLAAKNVAVIVCPECGKQLQLCPYPDYQGKKWYWCEAQDCYWHQDDLEHASEHADWIDMHKTVTSLRQDLY
jgi:predicted RNA-binding Zn-ribbon protein involved in translation (DUF1610 family)